MRTHGFIRWLGRVLATALVVAAGRATAGDWPRFLGPHGNGVSDETNLLERWPDGGPPVVWDKAVGAGYSAPSVQGHRLVLHQRQGNQEVVEGLEAATGKSLWRYAYPSHFIDPYGYNNGPRATPLLTTNRCFTFGAEGRLVCLNLADGALVWERDTGKDWLIPAAFFGVGSTPLLDHGRLLVMVGGQPDAGMVAFDPQTGHTLWESVGRKNWEGVPKSIWPGENIFHWERSDKQASYATPVAADLNGRHRVLCFMRQGLVSLDPRNGVVDDSFFFRAPVAESVNASDPVVVSNEVFISSAYYKTGSALLRVRPDNGKFEPRWRSRVLEIHWMTPLYRAGYLYAFSGRNPPDAHFACVELETGKLMWDVDERWAYGVPQPPVFGRGSCILAEDKLIVIGEGGLLGLFKVNPRRAEEVSRFQVPSLEFPCWAAPVLAHRRLYLRSEKRLVCLNLAR